MIEDQPSRWAQERFGAAAADLRRAVVSAVLGTHERAFSAHAGARASARDTYGTTVWVEQFDELKTATEAIPGVRVRKVPEMRRFSLPVVEQTAVVLYPWCYAKDPSQPRRTAKMKVSEARRSLLAPVPGRGPASSTAPIPARPKRRFDDAPLDDDFDLRPQNPLDHATDTEPDRPRPAIGSGDTNTAASSGTNGGDEETPER